MRHMKKKKNGQKEEEGGGKEEEGNGGLKRKMQRWRRKEEQKEKREAQRRRGGVEVEMTRRLSCAELCHLLCQSQKSSSPSTAITRGPLSPGQPGVSHGSQLRSAKARSKEK